MRQIKFRGLRVNNNEWVYGYYYKLTESQHYILKDIHRWSVIPFSVSQFTGLKDKNSKDIYEGDKIKGHTRYNSSIDLDGVVIFSNQMFCVKQIFENKTIFTPLFHIYKPEVIGNLHENK